MDRLSGYCSTCGEPLPVLAENPQPDSETVPADSAAPTGPEVLEWRLEGSDFAHCPVCDAIYDIESLPAKCERCADDPLYAGTLWILPDTDEKREACLVWLQSQEQVPLRDSLVLGRDSLSFLASDRYVSRKHASIRIEDKVVFIRDLDSVNGTFVNGERLKADEERELVEGDNVSLDQQHFRFQAFL